MVHSRKRFNQFVASLLLMAATVAAGCMPSPTEADFTRPLGVRLDGVVTNAVTGAGISGATVTTQGVTQVTYANTGGFLFIGTDNGLQAGTFPVIVRHDGYVDVQRDVVFLPNPNTNVANFQLQPKPSS
jgi:hypothetical protein